MADSHTRSRALHLVEFAHSRSDGELYRTVQSGRPGAVIAAELATVAAEAVAELAAARSCSFGEALSSLGEPSQ